MNVRPILDLIYKHEAAGAVSSQGVASVYDVVSAFIPKANRTVHPLTTYPIGEVLEWQRFVVSRGAKSSAAGAPQIIRATLENLVAKKAAGIGDIYNAETQDRLAVSLMEGRGLASFFAGNLSAPKFGDRLAREWASLPVHSNQKGASRNVLRGQSYYAGDGLNAAGATPDEVIAALTAARKPPEPPVPTDTLQEQIDALVARVAALEAIHTPQPTEGQPS